MSDKRESSSRPHDDRLRAPAAGETVPTETTRHPGGSRTKPSRRSLDPSEVTDWQSSSHALLVGLEVKDYTSRISTEVFDRLFGD